VDGGLPRAIGIADEIWHTAGHPAVFAELDIGEPTSADDLIYGTTMSTGPAT
jgi:hypothetical protein